MLIRARCARGPPLKKAGRARGVCVLVLYMILRAAIAVCNKQKQKLNTKLKELI